MQLVRTEIKRYDSQLADDKPMSMVFHAGGDDVSPPVASVIVLSLEYCGHAMAIAWSGHIALRRCEQGFILLWGLHVQC